MKDFLFRFGDALARMFGFGHAAEPMPRWLEICHSIIGWLCLAMVVNGIYKGLTS